MQRQTGTRNWAVAALTVAAAALGAAAVGANAGAADRPVGSTYVPMIPCRLFDTRPAPDQVGDRNTPIGEGETHSQPVHGVVGDCDVPDDAISIAINLTAVNGTAASFLTVAPGGEDLPFTSALNWVPGSPPLPNQVVVGTGENGAIDLFNAFGTVDVVGDVVGYNTQAGLESIADQLEQLDTSVEDLAGEFNTLDDAVSAKPDFEDVYTRAQIEVLHAGLPSRGGYVLADGTASANHVSFGAWEVTRVSTGTYRIDEIRRSGTSTCVGERFPLVVATPDDNSIAHVTTSCDVASGEHQAFVYLRRNIDDVLDDEPFQFVWISD